MYKVTDEQKDILAESFNQGIGKAASSFATLMGNRYEVELEVPEVSIVKLAEMIDHSSRKNKKVTSVELDYSGPFEGHSLMLYPFEDSLKLANLFLDTNENTTELTEDGTDALKEVANIVLNAGVGTIGNIFSAPIETGLPKLTVGDVKDVLIRHLGDTDCWILFVSSKFHIGQNSLEIDISLLMESDKINELLSLVDAYYKKLFG